MTVRERVLASRLVQKIDLQGGYSNEIGLSYNFRPEQEKSPIYEAKRTPKLRSIHRRQKLEESRCISQRNGRQ